MKWPWKVEVGGETRFQAVASEFDAAAFLQEQSKCDVYQPLLQGCFAQCAFELEVLRKKIKRLEEKK